MSILYSLIHVLFLYFLPLWESALICLSLCCWCIWISPLRDNKVNFCFILTTNRIITHKIQLHKFYLLYIHDLFKLKSFFYSWWLNHCVWSQLSDFMLGFSRTDILAAHADPSSIIIFFHLFCPFIYCTDKARCQIRVLTFGRSSAGIKSNSRQTYSTTCRTNYPDTIAVCALCFRRPLNTTVSLEL